MSYSKRIFLNLIFLLLIFSSCKKETAIDIVPFSKFTTPIIENGKVTFRNYSLNATEYLWDFDDGNTSTEKEPCYEYSSIGTFRVKLTASDGVNSHTTSKIVAIGQVYPPNLIQLDNLPFGPSSENISFTHNGKGYIAGGIQGGSGIGPLGLWEFDPATKEWNEKIESTPAKFQSGMRFKIEENVYMGLGVAGNTANDFKIFKYSIPDNSFTEDTPYPFSNNEGRVIDAASFSYGGKGYVIGQGQNQYQYGTGNNTKNIFEYDPGNQSWINIGDYPIEGNSGMMYFQLGEKLYIGMGNANSFSAYLNKMDFWEFNITTKTWTQKSNFPDEPRRDGIGFTYDGYGYVGFGASANPNTGVQVFKSDLWKYDHTNDTWEKIADFPVEPKQNLFAFVLDNSLYFGGGVSNFSFLDKFYEYQF